MRFTNNKNDKTEASYMINLAKTFCAAALLSSSIFGTNSIYADDNKVLATYSGGKVTETEIISQLKDVMGDDKADTVFAGLDAEAKKNIVKQFVQNKLLELEVKKQKIADSSAYQKNLKMIKDQLGKKVLLDTYLEKHVTDKMVNDAYDALVKRLQGQKEINTSHILVEDEEQAKSIKKRLDKGEKFADLANQFSKDEGSKVRGGDIGYTMRGNLVPEYENTAFAMKKNEISSPVKSQFGWHIIKLVDIRDVKVPSKQEAEGSIRQKLQMEEIEKYLDDLSKKAKLELKI